MGFLVVGGRGDSAQWSSLRFPQRPEDVNADAMLVEVIGYDSRLCFEAD